jgi:hypothetical protein
MMGVFRWFKGKGAGGEDPRLTAWKHAWVQACDAPSAALVAELTRNLNVLNLPEEEIEIEREMLAGLDELVKLHDAVTQQGLPVLQTGHRIVGREPCHFSAPCSMPDEPSQPGGRLMFTSVRAIFAGGATSITVPWHAVAKVLPQHRDVLLIRRDRETLYRFRCNVFGDALTAAFLARTLSSRRGSTTLTTP